MNITIANLGWWIAALWGAGSVLGWVQDWISDRWEITCGRPRIVRRWYGTHARVFLRAEAGDGSPVRYTVLQWDDEDTALPWLKVHKLNAERLRYWDEDAEPFWAPVTVFAPDSVRRVRPHLMRAGRVRVPWLTAYVPLRLPSGFLEGAR